MIMKRTILAAAIFLGTLTFSPLAHAVDGDQVFKFYCAQCHGLTGKGDGPNVVEGFPVSPRNFTKAEEMVKLSDADMRNVILDGGPSMSKSPMMPPWSQTLSDGEVDALIAKIRELCACSAP